MTVALLGVLFGAGFGMFGFAPGFGPSAARAQATAALPLAAPKPSVLGARLGIHPDKTRFVLELSESVPFTVAVLSDPYRVVVDLPDMAWPGSAPVYGGKGLIKRYAFNASELGGRRLVLETDGPVRVREAFLLPPKEGYGPRFVLDVERGSRSDVRPAPASPASPATLPSANLPAPKPAVPSAPRAVPAPLETETASRVDVTPVAAMTVPVPPVSPLRTQRSAGKPLIVIDPGHGGADPGAVGVGGVFEKEITLAMARELKRQLEATGRYRALLTRDKDVFVRLRDRVTVAREADADLFVSLHADSIGSTNVRGLSIYTLSDKASDREAEMLAAKENRADAIAGLNLVAENDQVVSILIDLAQRDTMNQSKRFASMALQSLKKAVTLLPTNPHRQAGFAVLTAPDVPSVLVEMGYLSSSKDTDLLTSPDYRRRMGAALIKGVDSYFKWLDGARRS
ncbi:N-acetylmuramoyl-L-alanine amidase [Azospirillum sp. SYSU D00513]|uniref:N-acetylmuramoyl-L-alanine amidase n=1 Tax=Azospirillum sp. SYSU D00513 TaxID=2812561 RepID=UPI0020004B3A|nr:N-acetylmuramoyl-L-alanine amidase [Azospirillum sp. SYSU D00513]